MRLPNGQVLLTGAELYNPHTGEWTSTGSLHAGRFFNPSTLLATG